MKKLYYFSESKLQFVQFKYLKLKLYGISTISIVICAAIIISGSTFNNQKLNPQAVSENHKSFNELLSKYNSLEKKFTNLIKTTNEIRSAVDLPKLGDEELQFGYGGGEFLQINSFKNEKIKLSKMPDVVEHLENKFQIELENYKAIQNKLNQNKKLFEALPAIKPCEGNLARSGFGMRFHPILKFKRMHNGIDIIASTGTKVISPGKGIVEFTGKKGGYGNVVEINHGFGYKTIFAHLSQIKVKQGQKINRGDLIALSGNSGLSTGPHLHYEVYKNGIVQDPEEYFFDGLKLF